MYHTETLQKQVDTVLRQLSEELNFFPKETAQLMYARQLTEARLTLNVPEGIGLERKMKKEEAEQRLSKMMEEAQLKWAYASEGQKKKVNEMEAVIAESNEAIRKIYEAALKFPDTP